MEITVLGPGCARCENTEKLIMNVAAEMGVGVALNVVKDPMKIAEYDIMSTPGVVIDGEVVSSGKVPSKNEVRAWIEERNRDRDES
jgi:small redox-active disulfide protein 2